MDLTTEIEPETELEEAPPPTLDESTAGSAPETVNLVPTIDGEILKKYGEEVFRCYEMDLKSSEEFRERRANIVRLYLGKLPPPPNNDMNYARVHYPIVATAVNRMHARIYDQQFPSSGEFFGVKPTDQNDLERTIRVAKHMNWQTAHRIPEYVPNHDVLIMQYLLYGSAFSIFYWDPTKGRPCHEACRTEDIILPYTERSTDPHLGDVSRITRIIRKSRHELEEIAETGYYDAAVISEIYDPKDANGNPPATNDDASRDTSNKPMTSVIDDAQGVQKSNEHDAARPREILEQHYWLKLGTEPKERPVVAAVDKETKKVLGLFLREDEDPNDKARFNREQAASEAAYQAAQAKWQMDMAAYFGQTMTPPPMPGGPTVTPMSPPGDPTMTQLPMQGPPTMTAPPMPGATDATMPMGAPPVPPEPPQPPAPVKMIPINFFTHFVCIPNPEGVYGWGIGYLLEGHNMVADTIAAQLVDAGTLANTFTFLYSFMAKLPRGENRVKPGEGIEVQLTPEQMKGAIFPITFPGPNPQMAEFVKDQKQEAEELSGAGEILSGEVGGSNETATTTQIRVSQALAGIAIINKRYTRARTAEAQNLARLNSVYMEDWEYFSVVDPAKPNVVDDGKVSRMDYLQDCDITVTADPRMASQPQRIAEAQTALQAIMASPLTANDPLMVAAGQKGLFEAMDRPDLVAGLDQMIARLAQQMMMGAPPPGAPPPGGPPPSGNGGGPAPTGPAVPMPKTVPNGGPTPTNGPQVGGQVS